MSSEDMHVKTVGDFCGSFRSFNFFYVLDERTSLRPRRSRGKHQESKLTSFPRDHSFSAFYIFRPRPHISGYFSSATFSFQIRFPSTGIRRIHLIPKWLPFLVLFLFPCKFALMASLSNLKFKRIFNLERGHKGQIAWKQKHTKMAVILE